MMTAAGIVWVVFGLMVVIAQLVSTMDFGLAQRLGLQEKDANTEPLYRGLELTTARWDLVVLWTLPVAGALMLADHEWWPRLALVAGGVCVDTAGREVAKVLGLRNHGVKTGSVAEARFLFLFFFIMSLIGVWCIAYGLVAVA